MQCARTLPVADFGVLAIALAAYYLVLAAVRSVVADVYVVRFSATPGAVPGRAVRQAQLATLALAGVPALALVAAGSAGIGAGGVLIALGAALPVLLYQDVRRSLLIAAGRTKMSATSSAVVLATQAGGGLLLHLAGRTSVPTLLLVWAVAAAAGLLVVRLRSAPPGPRPIAGWFDGGRSYWPRFLLEACAEVGATQVALLLVAALAGSGPVGGVRAALLLLAPVLVLLQAAGHLTVAEAARTGPADLPRFMLAGQGLCLVASGAWVALMLLLPDAVPRVLVGDSLDGAEQALPGMAAFLICWLLLTAPQAVLRVSGRAGLAVRLRVGLMPLLLGLPSLAAASGGGPARIGAAFGAFGGLAVLVWTATTIHVLRAGPATEVLQVVASGPVHGTTPAAAGGGTVASMPRSSPAVRAVPGPIVWPTSWAPARVTATGRRPSPPRPPPPPSGRPAALAGTLAVLLGVGAGKWGSYLGVPPLFPTDLLLILASVNLGVTVLIRRGGRPTAAARSWPGAAVAGLVAYAVIRFLLGADHSLVAIRDFAPYAYGAVAFLSALSYARSTAADRARTLRLLHGALLFHLGWVVAALVAPGAAAGAPVIDAGQDLRFFSLRLATDGTIIGVLAALHLARFLSSARRLDLVMAAGCALVVAGMAARAALLSTALAVVVVVVAYALSSARSTLTARRKMLVLGLVPLAGTMLLAALPFTTAGSKLLSSLGLIEAKRVDDLIGIGTQEGRDQAWRLVIDYVGRSGDTLLGLGFGPDFLYDSGARAPLGGIEALRSPHNYLIGTYARLGLVGLVLFLLVLAAAAREAVRLRHRLGQDHLLLLAVILPTGILVSAIFGVELESPFCAVPFFWSLGILLSRPSAVIDSGALEDGEQPVRLETLRQ